MINIFEHDHGIRELCLARPPANALNRDLLTALDEMLERAGDEARAVVLSGAPGLFTGGLDVPFLLRQDRDGMVATWSAFFGVMRRLAASPVPVAAAITGHSPAGGCVLALFCDHRVMAAGEYRIGLNEVQVGIPLPQVLLHAMRRTVGARRAEDLVVSGRLLASTEAQAVGLVDELAPLEEVVARALAWCGRLLALPPAAMSDTRRRARADICRLFDALTPEGVAEEVERCWYGVETQRALAELAQRLGGRS